MSTFDRVKSLIVDHFGTDVALINLGSNLHNDLALDSLDDVELAMAVEEEFDISVPDDQLDSFVTVNDFVKFVDAKAADLS
jgi:acyl carrier protein